MTYDVSESQPYNYNPNMRDVYGYGRGGWMTSDVWAPSGRTYLAPSAASYALEKGAPWRFWAECDGGAVAVALNEGRP